MVELRPEQPTKVEESSSSAIAVEVARVLPSMTILPNLPLIGLLETGSLRDCLREFMGGATQRVACLTRCLLATRYSVST